LNNFNSLYEKKIFTQVEEITPEAGQYNKLQDFLKTQTTELKDTIEKKGKDAYDANCHNNNVLVSNRRGIVRIDNENRRYAVYETSSEKINDSEHFMGVQDFVRNNIENISGFFYNYEGVRPCKNPSNHKGRERNDD